MKTRGIRRLLPPRTVIVETVQRFVVTHVSSKLEIRQLTFPQQGRWTYPTRDDAQKILDTFRGPNGLERVLNAAEIATLKVLEVPCYAGHFDPVGCYPDDPADERPKLCPVCQDGACETKSERCGK